MKRFCVSFLLLALAPLAIAQDAEVAPKIINYQGKLTDATNQPLGGEAGGTFGLRFAIFAQATGGNAVWAEERDVVVIGGVFNVALGGAGGTPVDAIQNDLGAAFEAKDRFLETTVVSGPGIAAEQTLLPRQQLVSTPYSLVSQSTERAAVATLAESLIPALTKALNPPGTIIAYGGAVTDNNGLVEPVPGYLLCNGAVINATSESGKYAALKAALQNVWGNGGDSNADTVNLPDLRGVFLRGWSGVAGDGWVDEDRNNASIRVARKSGGASGNAVGSFQQDELQSHNHHHNLGRFCCDANGATPQQAWYLNYEDGWGDNALNTYTHFTGGSETRGKNAYVAYLIKY